MTTNPNAAISYDDGDDDVLVGIVNDTHRSISSITLTGPETPFGFYGDGACDGIWIFAAGNPCGSTTFPYGHQGVTFSAISADTDTGTVDFAGGIAPGGNNWFSLEGPVDVNLKIVPEPGGDLLLLVGTCLVGTGRVLRRKLRS